MTLKGHVKSKRSISAKKQYNFNWVDDKTCGGVYEQSEKNIYGGQSGAGKGVVAEEVAQQLGWKFINADVLASVASIGRSVTDVFGAGSEDKFNQTLTEILQHQVTQENIVVTTDENVACDPKAREILKSEFTVYIEVSTSVQAERMSNYRPLLPVNDYSALLDELQKERNPWFAEVASFTINSDNGDIDRDAKSVVEAYNK